MACSMHSTLAIDVCRLIADQRTHAVVLGCIDVGVVEGVDRTVWRDLGVKAPTGCQVADGKLDEVVLGMPEEENLERPTLPLGELASRFSCPAGSCRQVAHLGGGAVRACGASRAARSDGV